MWPLGPHHARTTLISVVRVQPRASEGITDLLSTPECGNTTTEHMVFEPSKTQREREEREREGKRIKKDLTSIFYPSPPSSLFSLDVHLIHTKQFGDSPPPRFPIMFSFSNSRTYTGGFPPTCFLLHSIKLGRIITITKTLLTELSRASACPRLIGDGRIPPSRQTSSTQKRGFRD